ncbi:hypothetical protein [Streptomyces sp. NPDC051218]|uniref:hypothetical protein n=1 Tax=Streptomyces sp. NPDC051218 TaxID=3365645 RepID=UPI0037AE9050
MRTTRAMWGSAAGAVAALALVVMGAPQAAAGGSTSVLVVSPESGQSTALYMSDEEYGDLERGLGVIGDMGKGRSEEPPGLSMDDPTRQINVTWMLHDVQPWRVDRAYPVAPGKDGEEGKEGKEDRGAAVVWIHTTTDVESMTGTWHKAKDPTRLTALFKKLGVLGATADRGRHAIPPRPESTPPQESTAASGPRAGSGQAAGDRSHAAPGDDSTDWWWAIPGGAAGAAGVLLLRGPLAERRSLLASPRGRRAHENGPRQELRDV